MHSRDEVRVYKEVQAGAYSFCLEEYWEEDDSGYCVSDFVLSGHTRLKVLDGAGSQVRLFDFDGLEYDKDLWLEDGAVCMRWQPAFDEVRTARIDPASLEVLDTQTRPAAVRRLR